MKDSLAQIYYNLSDPEHPDNGGGMTASLPAKAFFRIEGRDANRRRLGPYYEAATWARATHLATSLLQAGFPVVWIVWEDERGQEQHEEKVSAEETDG
jgi:hypothetical protein